MKKSKKIIWIPIVSVLAILLILGIILFVNYYKSSKTTLDVSLKQIEQTQDILVEWDTSKPIDKVTITVSHGKDTYYKATFTDTNTIAKGFYTVPSFYGNQKVNVEIKRGIYKTNKSESIGLSADEYNIAPITGTMPVTMFSLSLKDITDNYNIPTFVWFKRSGVWDYSKMPTNVYAIPVIDSQSFLNDSMQDEVYKKTSEWVKELYSINPNSHFNFYYNDYFAYGWMQATIANEIPKENYHVTLLSDGTASFTFFNELFDNDDASYNYQVMQSDYTKLKQEIAENKSFTIKSKYTVDALDLAYYPYVMIKEEDNVDWWLTRVSGTLALNNSDVADDIANLSSNSIGKIKVKDLNTLLKNLNEQEKQLVKDLYNFSDAMFEKATSSNKKIMVILGTWTADEVNFDEYVKATQKYYGDDYIYYYKGHPRNPTAFEKGKLEHLESLNLIDIDSTIAAELIFFFNPEASTTGYQSSTFLSLSDEQSGGIFNVRKDNITGDIELYKDKIDFFVTKIEAENDPYYSLRSNDKCYVLEFMDTTEYDIGVYDYNSDTLKYYKQNGSSWDLVK